MNIDRFKPWLITFAVMTVLAAAGGYAIGSGAAVGISDVDRARDESFRTAHDRAEDRVRTITAKRGFVTGLKRGRAAGERVGTREGRGFGRGESSVQFSEAEEAAAQSAAAAARAAISARQSNCGVVSRAPGWCPTADELANFRAAVRASRQAKEEKQAKEKQAKSKKKKSDDGDG